VVAGLAVFQAYPAKMTICCQDWHPVLHCKEEAKNMHTSHNLKVY